MRSFACVAVFLFFKQKTSYEIRISDWSSDVCSSDLRKAGGPQPSRYGPRPRQVKKRQPLVIVLAIACNLALAAPAGAAEPVRVLAFGDSLTAGYAIGRASCRERVCQYG